MKSIHSFLVLTFTASLGLAPNALSDHHNCADEKTTSKVSTQKSGDIVDTAIKAKNFGTLLAAAKAAKLVDTFKSDGPFTVFAPTDEAFAKLPKGTLEQLLMPENIDQLRSVLTYHVVSGKILSSAALSAGMARTLQGGKVFISSTADGANVNDAKLVALDIETSNGVIHVIDRVLMPQGKVSREVSSGRQMIEMAIERGVPLYNAGQHAACAAVYEVAAHAVMEIAGSELCDASRDRMSVTLQKLDQTHDSTDRAWMLRRALDTAHTSLMNPASAGDDVTISEFGKGNELNWSVVNDGVMGGLSKGNISFTDAGTLRFKGMLSLDNNGGFSSIRSARTKMDLSDASGVVIRVKGDGRTYQLRFGTDERYRGMEISFKADFTTKEGVWSEIRVPFDALRGSFRGRDLTDRTFDSNQVERLWILLGDKKAGPFELEIDWIRAYTESMDT